MRKREIAVERAPVSKAAVVARKFSNRSPDLSN